jgi:hypothetical protein
LFAELGLMQAGFGTVFCLFPLLFVVIVIEREVAVAILLSAALFRPREGFQSDVKKHGIIKNMIAAKLL